MGKVTSIGWCDHTFVAWVGCNEVSPACDHCYAREWAKRYGRWRGLWGPPRDTPRKRTSVAYWRQPLLWDRDAARDHVRHRVFLNDYSDTFEVHAQLDPWRQDLWNLVESTPHLDWLLLTKRPEQIARMLPPDWLSSPRPNVWLGTTAETQRWATLRIPRLLQVPAVVHFVSAEPLLDELDLSSYLGAERINWVITGGESGASFRSMDVEWVRAIRDQCRAAGAAFFHKQGAHRYPSRGVELDGRLEHAWPPV
jgi:protein gp37